VLHFIIFFVLECNFHKGFTLVPTDVGMTLASIMKTTSFLCHSREPLFISFFSLNRWHMKGLPLAPATNHMGGHQQVILGDHWPSLGVPYPTAGSTDGGKPRWLMPAGTGTSRCCCMEVQQIWDPTHSWPSWPTAQLATLAPRAQLPSINHYSGPELSPHLPTLQTRGSFLVSTPPR